MIAAMMKQYNITSVCVLHSCLINEFIVTGLIKLDRDMVIWDIFTQDDYFKIASRYVILNSRLFMSDFCLVTVSNTRCLKSGLQQTTGKECPSKELACGLGFCYRVKAR